MIVARSSGPVAVRRFSSSSSVTAEPEPDRSSIAPASMTHALSSFDSSPRISASSASWSVVSTKQPTAPESLRIHCSCSPEEVS